MLHNDSSEQGWLQLAVLVLLIAQCLPRSATEVLPVAAADSQPVGAAQPLIVACATTLPSRPALQQVAGPSNPLRTVVLPAQPEETIAPAPPSPEPVQPTTAHPPVAPEVAPDFAETLEPDVEPLLEPWSAPEIRITLAVHRPMAPRSAELQAPVLERISVTGRQHWQRMLAGDADGTYERLRANLAQNLSNTSYLGVLAVAALRAERFAEAEVIYRHLLTVDRSEPRWWMGLATAQQGLGSDSRPAGQQVLALAATDSVLHRRASEHLLLARGGGGAEPQARLPVALESTS